MTSWGVALKGGVEEPLWRKSLRKRIHASYFTDMNSRAVEIANAARHSAASSFLIVCRPLTAALLRARASESTASQLLPRRAITHEYTMHVQAAVLWRR